jgi:hypothetical protein
MHCMIYNKTTFKNIYKLNMIIMTRIKTLTKFLSEHAGLYCYYYNFKIIVINKTTILIKNNGDFLSSNYKNVFFILL